MTERTAIVAPVSVAASTQLPVSITAGAASVSVSAMFDDSTATSFNLAANVPMVFEYDSPVRVNYVLFKVSTSSTRTYVVEAEVQGVWHHLGSRDTTATSNTSLNLGANEGISTRFRVTQVTANTTTVQTLKLGTGNAYPSP